MSSRIQPFQTDGFRLIKPGFGDSETLAGIYAFGLGDPANDNLFAMPGGNLRFPGALQWGLGKDAAVEWFQSRTIDMSKPPAYALISQAANLSGVGGNGHGTFYNLELNDPSWNQAFGTLNAPWIVESIFFSKSTNQGAGHDGTLYGQRTYDPFGGGVFVVGGGSSGSSLREYMGLYNAHVAAPTTVEQVNGYGQAERLLSTTANGVSGQWITHWNNDVVGPAAGDGPAWVVDIDGRFSHLNTAAAWQAYQRNANPAVGGWGWRAFGLDPGGTVRTILDVNTDGGSLNGNPLATLDTGGVIVESFISAKIDWRNTGGTYQLVPAKPGYTIVQSISRILITNAAGVQTANPTLKAGNNAGGDNFVNQSGLAPTPASTAFAIAGGVSPAAPYQAGSYAQSSTNANSQSPILSTPIMLTVVVGATGATQLQGYVVTICTLVPLSAMP